MISYEKFVEEATNKITDYLPDEYRNATVSIQTVTKANDTELQGISILKSGENICPNIYLIDYYRQYMQTGDLEATLKQIAETRIRYDAKPMDLQEVLDWERIRSKVTARVINIDTNQKLLSKVPYTPLADLAVTYHVQINMEAGQEAVARIDHALLHTYGVSVEELHKEAMKNISKPENIRITKMSDLFAEAGYEMEPEMVPLTILTNQSGSYGAGLIASDQALQMAAKTVGENFYILPSSVHEVLLLPKNGEYESEILQEMVKSVNATELDPLDILSDRVYEYNARTHRLTLAGDQELTDQMKQAQALTEQTTLQQDAQELLAEAQLQTVSLTR